MFSSKYKNNMKIKRILVTGSSGTIGTRLCEFLLEKKFYVVGIDRKENRWKESVNKITKILDICDSDSMEKLKENIDLVVHLAANARVYDLVLNPYLALENFITAFNILEYCRKNNIKKIIFASSRETYGNSEKVTYDEDEVHLKKCESPYAASKIGGESLISAYQKCYNIDFVIFRFSNVYGMYDDSDRVIPLFIKKCLNDENLTVFGKNKLLDFTYIDDAITAVMLGIEKFDNVKNNAFNLGFGEGNTILDVANIIKKFLNTYVKISIGSNRKGEVIQYIANISKAKKMLGYSPKTNLAEGIRKSIVWYNDYLNS